jgi:hypothetical protein
MLHLRRLVGILTREAQVRFRVQSAYDTCICYKSHLDGFSFEYFGSPCRLYSTNTTSTLHGTDTTTTKYAPEKVTRLNILKYYVACCFVRV